MFYASFDLEEIYTELIGSQKAKGRLSTDWHNTCISVYYPVCLSSCLPACLSVSLAICLSIDLPVYLRPRLEKRSGMWGVNMNLIR